MIGLSRASVRKMASEESQGSLEHP